MSPKYTEGMSPHKAEVCARLSPGGQKNFRYIEFDDQEELLAEIHKDPIGLFYIIASGSALILVLLIGAILLGANLSKISPNLSNSSANLARTALVLVGILLIILIGIGTLVAAIIYRASVIFITNQKIAEVLYVSLFNRKVTQLGMGNVEDVTVQQKGILPRIFDYGTLLVETAGEVENCIFPYVPRPNPTSQIIINAHEKNVHQYGN